MASISSPGLGSGLDVSGIISKLMEVERQPLTALTQKEASYQAKLTAFGTMQGALSGLQTAVQTLKTASTFTAKTATVSDTTVATASATNSASTGITSITVRQLATYQSVRSNVNYGATSDTFSTGTLAITVNGSTKTVTIDSSNNTLSGIRQAINEADAGVSANVVNDGTTNRLVLTSKTSGTVGAVTVVTSELANNGEDHSISELDTSIGNTVVSQIAQDADLTINGIDITRSSNLITDAVDGLTINLLKASPDNLTKTNISVSGSTTAVSTAIDTFVKAYNEVVNQAKTLSAYDATNKKASVLTGDSTIRNVQAQLKTVLWSTVSGLSGGITSLSDIGIRVQKDGTLQADTAKLNTALSNPEIDVAGLFAQDSTGNEGIAVRFANLIDGIIGTDGMIPGRTEGITTLIRGVQRQSATLSLRLEMIETRYRTQFSSLDTLVASMQKTSQYLTQQLASLPTNSK